MVSEIIIYVKDDSYPMPYVLEVLMGQYNVWVGGILLYKTIISCYWEVLIEERWLDCPVKHV